MAPSCRRGHILAGCQPGGRPSRSAGETGTPSPLFLRGQVASDDQQAEHASTGVAVERDIAQDLGGGAGTVAQGERVVGDRPFGDDPA